jgi:maltose O-acetyltransferase
LIVAISGRFRRRFGRAWRRLLFEVDAMGSLRSFAHGSLCLDSPVRVGGGQGTLEIGDRVGLGCYNAERLGNGEILLEPRDPKAVIRIGSETNISNNVSIVAMSEVRIGNRCRIGDLVQVLDCDYHEVDPLRRDAGVGPVEPVTIGDNVWLGSRVMVLRGVTIGDNSVIGAGSLVTKSVPPNSVAVGVPARVIRSL